MKVMSRPRTEPGLQQIVLRYEDLLLRPSEAMASIWEFLSLEPYDVTGESDAEAEVFARHGTSETPAATIGRWRRDLSAEQAATAQAELEQFLVAFGYLPEPPA